MNDEDLVGAAAGGNHDAYAELVRRHQDEVYSLALRLTTNPDLASDVAQEAFIRAWRALPGFRGESKFSTWMYRIVVNAAWTRRKRELRRRSVPLEALVEDPPARSVSPETAAESRDLAPRLQAALSELTPAVRTVVVLKDVYEWDHSEIAGHLGISVTATKVRLHRGRTQLKVLLRSELEEGG